MKEVQKLQLHQLQNHFTVRFMKRLGGNLGWEEEARAHPPLPGPPLRLAVVYTSLSTWALGQVQPQFQEWPLGARFVGRVQGKWWREIPRASGTHCRPLILSQQEEAACSGLCIPASKVLSSQLWYDGFRLYRV